MVHQSVFDLMASLSEGWNPQCTMFAAPLLLSQGALRERDRDNVHGVVWIPRPEVPIGWIHDIRKFGQRLPQGQSGGGPDLLQVVVDCL